MIRMQFILFVKLITKQTKKVILPNYPVMYHLSFFYNYFSFIQHSLRRAATPVSSFGIAKLGYLHLCTELQKDYFCPVSWFSTEKCLNHVYGKFCHNMRHKSKHRLFCSFMVIWSWIVPHINSILSCLGQIC